MDELGELVRAIEPRCNGEEFNEYKRGILQCFGAMVFEILNTILRRYPDLGPHRTDPERGPALSATADGDRAAQSRSPEER